MRETLTAGRSEARDLHSLREERAERAQVGGGDARRRREGEEPGLGAPAPDDDDVQRQRHGHASGRSAVTAILSDDPERGRARRELRERDPAVS